MKLINRRKIGNKGENIVEEFFINKGYEFIDRNFTIKGGEIDLIFKKNNVLFFIEVKVIDGVNDIYGYVTNKKINSLKKAINLFLSKRQDFNKLDKKLLFVFVKNSKIFDIYEYYS